MLTWPCTCSGGGGTIAPRLELRPGSPEGRAREEPTSAIRWNDLPPMKRHGQHAMPSAPWGAGRSTEFTPMSSVCTTPPNQNEGAQKLCKDSVGPVSYTHLRAHETGAYL
eukprot:5133374-Pyramimonas_sp.AAC.1